MVLNILKAFGFAILIWIIGFVWGSFVFMTPALKGTPPIPFVSANPAISFPILLIWIPVTYLFARICLYRNSNPAADGFKVGIVFAVTNFILDLLMLALLLKAGYGYFASLTVWLGYFILLIIPWLTGRSLQKALA
ncbi:MAG TPA: hypothetical protein VN696_11475 [Pyrinomonadaceae bacterium]|nr:hypothetical protein [Pyrinomonadaceae bacterium]